LQNQSLLTVEVAPKQ